MNAQIVSLCYRNAIGITDSFKLCHTIRVVLDKLHEEMHRVVQMNEKITIFAYKSTIHNTTLFIRYTQPFVLVTLSRPTAWRVTMMPNIPTCPPSAQWLASPIRKITLNWTFPHLRQCRCTVESTLRQIATQCVARWLPNECKVHSQTLTRPLLQIYVLTAIKCHRYDAAVVCE